jgi:peptide/nickel transport system substrate-binding protein
MKRRLATAGAVVATMLCADATAALAQRQGGTLKVYQRENPPSASILEEATISTAFPFSPIFNNLVMYDPQKPKEGADTIIRSWLKAGRSTPPRRGSPSSCARA